MHQLSPEVLIWKKVDGESDGDNPDSSRKRLSQR